MHIHILGICGTFMGSLAVLAKRLGHRVTGSDANVYPPMSTQLEAQGIELTQGYDPTAGAGPDLVVIGNAMSRGNPAVEYVLNKGLPYVSGPQWLADHVLQGPLGAGRGRYPRQDHHQQHAGLGAGARRHEPGLPDRRRAAELLGVGPPGRYAVLRDRGRRIRQRLLRQALEVRPLPPAHRDPQQP
jgi:UDP-N-acetylmuramate: L-alanyl-gamma-D-glutamyl-meso-diaminopimelate ligase